jgi:hypothetical protein
MDRPRRSHVNLKYQPAGKRNPERPLERLLGCYVETGSGHGAKFLESIIIIIIDFSVFRLVERLTRLASTFGSDMVM